MQKIKNKIIANHVGALSVRNTHDKSQIAPLKNHRGITLIALIITIIVMIILVAVTVNVALNGGLFNISKKAAFQTEVRQIEEQMMIKIAELTSSDGNTDITISDLSISDELKEKYSDKLIIFDQKLYYNLETTNDEEKQWLEEIGINMFLEGYSFYSSLGLAVNDANNLNTDSSDIEDISNAIVALKIDETTQTANVILMQDITLDSNISFTQNIQFNLNNNTITTNNSIAYSNDFTIKNGIITSENGTIISSSVTSSQQDNTLRVENMELSINMNGGGGTSHGNIYTSSKNVYISNSKFTFINLLKEDRGIDNNIYAYYSDKIIAENSTFLVESGHSPYNICGNSNMQIEVNNCSFALNFTYISTRTAPIANIKCGIITVNSGIFNATSEEYTGALCNINATSTTINDGNFKSSNYNVYSNTSTSTTTINGGTFIADSTEGTAELSVANLYDTNGRITINGGDFSATSAGSKEAYIVNGSSISVTKGNFRSVSTSGTSYGFKSMGISIVESLIDQIEADIPIDARYITYL